VPETYRDASSLWAGNRLCFEIDDEAVLGEASCHVPHRRDLGHDGEAGVFELGTGGTVSIGGVADEPGRFLVVFEGLDEFRHGVFVRGVRRGEERLVYEL
jgi:hypothetical protein